MISKLKELGDTLKLNELSLVECTFKTKKETKWMRLVCKSMRFRVAKMDCKRFFIFGTGTMFRQLHQYYTT